MKFKSFVSKHQTGPDKWVVVDADGQVLGRMASKIAMIIRGKNKPTFTPHNECGDGVIVINAEKVVLTGNKKEEKLYHFHSGYPGGLKSIPYFKLVQKKPDLPIIEAVKGMLPKNRLGRKLRKYLKVYVGNEHPHTAQIPQQIEI